MEILSAVCAEGEAVLNRHAMELPGEEVSFRVHYWGAMPQHFDNPVHQHSFFEICYVLDGEGTYLDDQILYPLARGTMFYSRPGVLHQIRSKQGLFLLFAAFDVVEAGSAPGAAQRFRHWRRISACLFPEMDRSSIGLMWKALLVQAAEPGPLQTTVLRGLAHALLVSFQKGLQEETAPHITRNLQTEPSTLAHHAKLFIRDNLSQPLTLQSVAGYLHISGRHLSRIFSKELGQTFSTFTRRERIRQASSLLATTDLPVQRIAEETGFNSVHYFTRVFKQETGVPPALFRRKMCAAPPPGAGPRR